MTCDVITSKHWEVTVTNTSLVLDYMTSFKAFKACSLLVCEMEIKCSFLKCCCEDLMESGSKN